MGSSPDFNDLREPVNCRATRDIFGVPVQVATAVEMVRELTHRIETRLPSKVAFFNANVGNLICSDAEFGRLLRGFVMLNDGSGANLASTALYGRPFPENLNGTDFTPRFLTEVHQPLRVFLLGARPEVLQAAAARFAERWPRHAIVGQRDGYAGTQDAGAVLAHIRASQADLVLVAMGNRLQEQWVDRIVPQYACSAWGVGAYFDFLAGTARRAPRWVRAMGLEWLHRLCMEPGRLWRRYVIGNPLFVARVLRELVQRRLR